MIISQSLNTLRLKIRNRAALIFFFSDGHHGGHGGYGYDNYGYGDRYWGEYKLWTIFININKQHFKQVLWNRFISN